MTVEAGSPQDPQTPHEAARLEATVSQIEWGPPPPPTPPRPPIWVQRLAGFQDRPGEWGRLEGTYTHSTLSDLRRGYHTLPPGRWEFDRRPVTPGKSRGRHHIWARWLPPTPLEE